MTTMLARVQEKQDAALWVMDLDTSQEVLVKGETLSLLAPNDVIEVTFDGMKTKSTPLQIYASDIRLISSCGCSHVHAD